MVIVICRDRSRTVSILTENSIIAKRDNMALGRTKFPKKTKDSEATKIP